MIPQGLLVGVGCTHLETSNPSFVANFSTRKSGRLFFFIKFASNKSVAS